MVQAFSIILQCACVLAFFWIVWMLLAKAIPRLRDFWNGLHEKCRFFPEIKPDPVYSNDDGKPDGKPDRKELLQAFLKILLLIVVTRFAVFLVGYGVNLINARVGNLGFLETIPAIWKQWDATNYLFIAQHGYVTVAEAAKLLPPDPTDRYYLIVFLPFYPMLIKLAWFIIRDYNWAAIFVSNACLVGAAWMMYKLVRLDFNRSVAMRSVAYLLIFPVTFFLSIQFNESTFLFLMVSALYALRKKKWLIAGILSYALALTKIQGLLILLPFLLEVLGDPSVRRYFNLKKFGRWFLEGLRRIAPALLCPLGTATYLYMNYTHFGDPLQFLVFQRDHWGQEFGFFASNIGYMFEHMFMRDYQDAGYYAATIYGGQLFIILAAFAILCMALHRIRLSYAVFTLVYFIVILSPTALMSGPRYLLAIAYLFPVMAVAFRSSASKAVVAGMSGMMLGYSIMIYTLGYHLM
jgi:hypothetical protein